jgi:cytoskeletal protein CcmA (bactofilin family)
MWRKPAEGKPSPAASPTPVVTPTPVQSHSPSSPAPKSEPLQPSVPPAFSSQLLVARANAEDSRISAGLKINGEISGSSDLYIDGQAQGKIRFAQARVTVGPNGRVNADIEAREIEVHGTVSGNLKASERIHLGASSRVQGTLQTPRLGIEDGAKLRGKVNMTRAAETRNDSAAFKSPDKDDAEVRATVSVPGEEE